MHFMNPVPIMNLIEVIKGLATSEETLKTTLLLAKEMGKTTTISKDIPGFIANRCLMPYINEAIFTLYEASNRHKIIITRNSSLGYWYSRRYRYDYEIGM